MKQLLLYWSFMIAAYIIASKLRNRDADFSWVQKAMMGVVYVLCLLMGLRMGSNEEVISSLGSIGIMAFAVTVFCVGGSMLAIFLVRKILHMDRYGNLLDGNHSSLRESEDAQDDAAGQHDAKAGQEDLSKKENIRTTVIILGLVAVGMAAGALGLSKMKAEYISLFDSKSSVMLVVLLCVLLFFVGFDLGRTGGIFESLKSAGYRIILFPAAAILGTAILGTISCIAMGFTLKEGLAICLGFGWYTYAPVVITGAGQQYLIAGAVSFMHNVIRELAGIILIPLFARRFGYLESTGIPGVAAMDVCMPIVEKSCRQDTVIYSFATGLFMCIVTSVAVPLVMGL